jgi:hypothetical protein
VELNQARQDRRQETLNAVFKYWVDDEAREWIQSSGASTTLLESIRRVARKMPFKSPVYHVNRAVIQRIQQPRRGISNTRRPITIIVSNIIFITIIIIVNNIIIVSDISSLLLLLSSTTLSSSVKSLSLLLLSSSPLLRIDRYQYPTISH